MESKLFVGVISVFIAIVVVAAALVPVIQEAGTTTTTITTTISNDGAADLKLSKITDNFSLDMTVENDGSNLTITNGSDTINASLSPMFILSADSSAIYVNDLNDIICTWVNNGNAEQYTITGDFTVKITNSNLVINDGDDLDLPLPTSYLFIPSSTGMYGSFTAGDLNKVPDDPVIAASYYAGVAAYNANTTLGAALAETVIATDTSITSVSWNIPAPDTDLLDFDPDQITIQPIDPGEITIQPIDPGNQLMSVPTPTYTDGDWGYDLNGSNATIVSYSGSAGAITVPSTVGGYTVTQFGKGGISNVFQTNLSSFSVVIPDGITSIGGAAFMGCKNLTSVSIPESVTSTGGTVFNGCTALTSVNLPDSITTIKAGLFEGCTSLTYVSLGDNTTTINNDVFKGCTALKGVVIPATVSSIGTDVFLNSGVKQVLNLSELEITTSSYGLNADSVQDYIDALIYLAPYNVTESETVTTPNQYRPMLDAIPLIIFASILMFCIGFIMIRRSD